MKVTGNGFEKVADATGDVLKASPETCQGGFWVIDRSFWGGLENQ